MKPMTAGPIVILGGGPAGLGAAYWLNRVGFSDWVLYEREAEVGGLARSFRDAHGFTWDIGGHVLFSHYGFFSRLMDELLGREGWIEHERESWVRVLGAWVPYPFQNNLHRLPAEACAECLAGLIQAALARGERRFANFEEFNRQTFGPGINRLFMHPYNSKVWGYPPAALDAAWIAERVAVPDPARAARQVALKTDDPSWGPNLRFRFPRQGGTGAIWKALRDRLPSGQIVTGTEAVELELEARRVRFANGQSASYDYLISTLPLDQLARMAHRSDWSEAADRLACTSTHVIGVGLKGTVPPELKSKCWMYFPEPNCPFYRVTHFSHYSSNNVADIRQQWSLMAEVAESPQKPVDPEQVAEDTVRGLIAAGLLESPDQVNHTWTHFVKYGYPTPALGREEVVNRLLPALAEKRIFSRGRFGAWRYEVSNMDHCFMQGVEAAAHLLFGTPELTVWEPNLVNTPHRVLGWDRFR